MNLDFSGVMRRAWDITWRNKGLWILGILSAIGAGGGGRFNSNVRLPNGGTGDPSQQFRNLFPNLDQNTALAIGLGVACVALIIVLVFYVLSVIGRGGLIGGIQLADSKGSARLGEAWAIGVKNFVTVLLIGLVVAVIGVVIAIASVFAAATVCLLPLACLGFIIVAALNVFTYLAQIAAVTERLSVGEAFNKAWQMVKANIGAVAVLGIILAVIQGIVGFVVALPLGLILVPLFAGVVGFASENRTAGGAAFAIAGLCFVAWLPVLIIVRGIVETWVTSAWTLAYRQLSTQTGSAPAAAPLAPPPMAR